MQIQPSKVAAIHARGIHIGNLIHLKKDNRSKFIFMDTEVNSGYFSPFPNLFADTPFNYINSKGETIPKGEDIMNI